MRDPGDAPVLRITTLNLLHDQIRNSLPSWTARRVRAIATLRALASDLVCLQEVSLRQLDDLRSDLPEYEVCAGRPGGPVRIAPWLRVLTPLARGWWGDYVEHGELCPILLRRGAVERIAERSEPLAPPPRVLVTAATPHVVTSVRFRIVATGAEATIFNTHLGLLPWRKRDEAERLLTIMNHEPRRGPQFVAGDFNARPDSPLLNDLRAAGFHDLWQDARERHGSESSYDTLAWLFGRPRIDFVMARPAMAVARAGIMEYARGDVAPSDHHPVTVEVEGIESVR